jgi:hypothetical protein
MTSFPPLASDRRPWAKVVPGLCEVSEVGDLTGRNKQLPWCQLVDMGRSTRQVGNGDKQLERHVRNGRTFLLLSASPPRRKNSPQCAFRVMPVAYQQFGVCAWANPAT